MAEIRYQYLPIYGHRRKRIYAWFVVALIVAALIAYGALELNDYSYGEMV